jgi:hypothetical protein
MDNLRLVPLTRRKHDVVEIITIVPDSEFCAQSIAIGGRRKQYWLRRRKWREQFLCHTGFSNEQ